MADDKRARDEQARDAENRRRERDAHTDRQRMDEPEPPVDPPVLDDLEGDLESLTYPATGADVVAAVGDRELESPDGIYSIGELVPDTDAETYDSPDAVRVQIERPAVAAAMKRVVEASKSLPDADLRWSRRKAYDKTFRELKAIDADDEDEGVRVIADWIVERISEKGTLPKSRAVRREAAKFCRSEGYEVRNDEWLGI